MVLTAASTADVLISTAGAGAGWASAEKSCRAVRVMLIVNKLDDDGLNILARCGDARDFGIEELKCEKEEGHGMSLYWNNS